MKPKKSEAPHASAAPTPPTGSIPCQCGAHGTPPPDDSRGRRLSGSFSAEDVLVEVEMGLPSLFIKIPGGDYFTARLSQQCGAALLEMLARCQARIDILRLGHPLTTDRGCKVEWSGCDPEACEIVPGFVSFSRSHHAFTLWFNVVNAPVAEGRALLLLKLNQVAASALRYRLAQVVE